MKTAADGPDDPHTAFTEHARRRTAERCVRNGDLALLLQVADREAPVGSGCIAISMSNRRREELAAEGYAANAIERAARVVAVQGADGAIVTVLRPGGRKGRRYRRGWNSHRPDAKIRRGRRP